MAARLRAARAEVESTLEWARTQAAAIVARAQHGAEQLLAAAGLGPEAIAEVSEAIVAAANAAAEANRARSGAAPAATTEQPAAPRLAAAPEPEPEPEPEVAQQQDEAAADDAAEPGDDAS